MHQQESDNQSVLEIDVDQDDLQIKEMPNTIIKQNPLQNLKSQESFSYIDRKKFQNIKLTKYLHKNCQGKLIQIAYYNEKNQQVDIDKEFQKNILAYSKQDIAFIGVLGSKGCGKSFFCDKIFDLCEVKSNYSTNKKTGIYFWSQPFIKNGQLIFLLELTGHENMDERYFKLLSYFLIMTSSVIHIRHIKYNEKEFNFEQQLDEVFKIFGNKNRWKKLFTPIEYYDLKRTHQQNDIASIFLPDAKNQNNEIKNEELIHTFFLDQKFINQKYIIAVSHLFQNILSEVQTKKFEQLVYRGNVLLKIMGNIQLNLRQQYEDRFDKNQIYQNIVKQLYDTAFRYCIMSYHNELRQALQEEQALSLNNLFQIFQNSAINVLNKFNQFSLDKQKHQQYQNQLNLHIEIQQQRILKANRNRTKIFLEQSFKIVDQKSSRISHDDIKNLRNTSAHLDHDRTNFIIPRVRKIFKDAIFGNASVEDKIWKKIDEMKFIIDDKKKQLDQYKRKKQQIQIEYKQYEKKQKKINEIIQSNKIKLTEYSEIVDDNQNILQLKDQKIKLQNTFKRNQDILNNNQLLLDNNIKKQTKQIIQQINVVQKNIRQRQNQLQSLLRNVQKSQDNQKNQKTKKPNQSDLKQNQNTPSKLVQEEKKKPKPKKP